MEGTELNNLIIIGARGHGKVVADIAQLIGYKEIVFLDNNHELKECDGYPVLGPDTMSKELGGDIFIAIGNSKIRKRLMEREKDRKFPVLIHPSSVIAKDVEIGEGSVIMAGAVINSGAKVGRGCIINTSSSVDHDCVVGDFCHISVGAHLSGTVEVGEETWIGAGTTVSNNLSICSNVTIGVGAAVIRNITENGTYIGVPAKKICKFKLIEDSSQSKNIAESL